MTDQTPYLYPTHPDGRRKLLSEMTSAELEAFLAVPVEALPEDVRPTNLDEKVRGRLLGPRTNSKGWAR